MKKFLSILLVITMTFSITACGSVEDGTKGTVEGNGFVATWSKAFMGSTITLNVKASEKNGNLIREGYEVTEEVNNYSQDSEGNMIVPISMDKKLGKDTITYTIKPIKAYMTEEGASIDILIKDAMGTDVITAFVLTCNVGKEIPLSISIADSDLAQLYVNVPVSGDGLYAVGFYNTANGVEIAINNPDDDEWQILEYDEEMFKLGNLDYLNKKVILPITALKEGNGNIVIKNIQKGVKYSLKVGVAAYYDDAGNFVDFNTRLLSVESIKEQTKIAEVKGYEKAAKVAKKLGLSEEFEGIEIPEGFNVVDIDVAGGTEDPGKIESGGEGTTQGGESQGGESQGGQSQGGQSQGGQSQGGQSQGGQSQGGQGQGGQGQGGQGQGGQGQGQGGQGQGGSTTVIEVSPSYEQIIEKEKKEDARLEELEKALESGDSKYFDSEEEKEEYRKALEEEKKNMDMPERVSSDNTNYSMIQCNLLDQNNVETALVLSSADEVSLETLVKQYDGYKSVMPDMQIKKVKVSGIDVTIIYANGFAAALFTKGKINYVYEQMGVNFTEAQAIAQVERYIGLNAQDLSKFAAQ